MANGDHLGPALAQVEPDDAEAVQAMFAEQRARLAVVREHRIWQWFGGVPWGFGSQKALLHGLWLQLAAVGLFAIGLLVAGFTRGPWLWGVVAAALACLLLRWLVLGLPSRRTVSFYRRATLAPAVVVGAVPDADPSLAHVRCVVALVAPRGLEAAGLRAFVAAGDRLRAMVDGSVEAPGELAGLVAAIRGDLATRRDDGRRIEAPAALGAGLEVARFFVPLPILPREEFSSRLLFVLLDPRRRGAGSTRVVQSSLWGNGVERLCEAFPWEGAR